MQLMEKKIEYNFHILNAIMLVLFVLILLLIITVDYAYCLAEFEGEEFRVWYYDSAIGFNTGQEKGPGMLFSIIFDIIAAIIFFLMAFKLQDIRKLKNAQQADSSAVSPEKDVWQPTLRIFLRDSLTGERSGVILNTSRGEEFAKVVARSDDKATKSLLREWAKLLKEAVDAARAKNRVETLSKTK